MYVCMHACMHACMHMCVNMCTYIKVHKGTWDLHVLGCLELQGKSKRLQPKVRGHAPLDEIAANEDGQNLG